MVLDKGIRKDMLRYVDQVRHVGVGIDVRVYACMYAMYVCYVYAMYVCMYVCSVRCRAGD